MSDLPVTGRLVDVETDQVVAETSETDARRRNAWVMRWKTGRARRGASDVRLELVTETD